jgi:hypothetical protein
LGLVTIRFISLGASTISISSTEDPVLFNSTFINPLGTSFSTHDPAHTLFVTRDPLLRVFSVTLFVLQKRPFGFFPEEFDSFSRHFGQQY